jgi:hypothetical protein
MIKTETRQGLPGEHRVLFDAELASVSGGMTPTPVPLSPTKGGPIHEPILPILPIPVSTGG